MSSLGLAPFLLDDKKYSSHEVIEVLSPLLTDSRLEKMHQVLDNRCWSVAPVLENIYDRGNVSAVMRSAEAFGFCNFNIIEREGAKFKESQRVTQGTDKWLCTKKFKKTKDCVTQLKSQGFKVYVTDLESAKPISEIDFTHPAAIVFGNEKEGASDEIKKVADATFILPMLGFAQSFNISVAAALTFQFIYLERIKNLGQHADLSGEQKNELLAHYMIKSLDRSHLILKEKLTHPV